MASLPAPAPLHGSIRRACERYAAAVLAVARRAETLVDRFSFLYLFLFLRAEAERRRLRGIRDPLEQLFADLLQILPAGWLPAFR